MKQYDILIEETVSQKFTVSADSEADALKIARQKYSDSEFVLEPGNLIDVKFNILTDNSSF